MRHCKKCGNHIPRQTDTCEEAGFGEGCGRKLNNEPSDTVDEIVELAKGLIRADTIQESAKATIDFREGVTKALQQEGERVRKLKEALQWCSGSADFGEGGIAREGWLKVCEPLLKDNSTKNNHE